MTDDRETFLLDLEPGGMALVNVHPESQCAGRHCVLHNPSDHHMKDWPLNWRSDRRIMERMCPHGVGHPDPDDVAYLSSIGQDSGVHGCCGCCTGLVGARPIAYEDPNDED